MYGFAYNNLCQINANPKEIIKIVFFFVFKIASQTNIWQHSVQFSDSPRLCVENCVSVRGVCVCVRASDEWTKQQTAKTDRTEWLELFSWALISLISFHKSFASPSPSMLLLLTLRIILYLIQCGSLFNSLASLE